jgi:hypothetical protein
VRCLLRIHSGRSTCSIQDGVVAAAAWPSVCGEQAPIVAQVRHESLGLVSTLQVCELEEQPTARVRRSISKQTAWARSVCVARYLYLVQDLRFSRWGGRWYDDIPLVVDV